MLERSLEKQICAETTVIGQLIASEKTARELRDSVNQVLVQQRFQNMSGPTFYQFMSQMEGRRVVTCEVRPKLVEGQTIQERWYKYTGGGTRLNKPESSASEGLDFGGLRGPQFA